MRAMLKKAKAAIVGLILALVALGAGADMSRVEIAAKLNPAVYQMTSIGCTATKIGPREYLTAGHCARSLSPDMRLESLYGEYIFIRSAQVSTIEKGGHPQGSPREDWAILHASSDSKGPYLDLACGQELVLGAGVAYIGFPQSIDRQLGVGYIASVNPAESNGADFFIDVPGAPGASGSAIVSTHTGQIVGVLTEGVFNTRTGSFFLVGVESVESLDACEDWDKAMKYWDAAGEDVEYFDSEDAEDPTPVSGVVDHT